MSAAAGKTAYDETGAGGKFRRKPLRKYQATPYERPATAIRNTTNSGNGWFSKIIDPASKLINASAHRLFGLAFRKRLLPPPQQPMPPPAARQDATGINITTGSVPRSEVQFKVGDQSRTNNHSREQVLLDNDGRNQGISELEKILAQKTFTESEINRLTALLNSRTVEDNGKIESEKRAPKTTFEDGNASGFKSPLVPDNGCNSIGHPGVTSSLFSNVKVTDDEIATPAELAKAYMGSRTSKVSPSMLGSRSQTIKRDLPLINNVVFPSQSSSTVSANKYLSRVSTPENGYMTPRLRGRSAIYSMARTPYSRSQKGLDIRSVNRDNFESPQLALEANKISSSRQRALKRRSNMLDDDIGSAGPMRRIRQRPSLLSSKRLNEPDGGSSPTDGPGPFLNYRSKNVQSKTPDENFMSIPSQSSVVAQKILQQLEKLTPPPKEKSSEKKLVVSLGNSAFALRSLEKAESSKIIESSQEISMVNDSAQRVATNEDFIVLNGKNKLEENGPQNPTSTSKSNSENALTSCRHPLAENKQAFQDNNPKTKSDQNGTVPNGSKYGKEGKVSCLEESPQPAATDNSSPPSFDKVSSDEQTTITPRFGQGTKVPDKFPPSSFTSSSPTAIPESRISNSSGLSDTSKTNSGDSIDTQGVGVVDARPSTTSNGISQTTASDVFANNGFANSSFSVQPALSQFSATGDQNMISLTSTVSTAGVPSAATGNPSSGASLFSTSVAPFSVSSVFGNSLRKDPQVFTDVNGSPSDGTSDKPITATNNTTSNPFPSGGTSSAIANGSNIFSGIGSSMSSPKKDSQGLGSISNADSNLAKIATPAAESVPQNTVFKFGSSGFSSSPTFLSGTTNSAPANSMTSLQAPMFGQNSLDTLKEAGSVNSNAPSSNNLFGSSWKPNSTPLFGSTISSSTVPPPVFQFGSSASSSAPISSSIAPGSLFASSFSFSSAASGNSPSLFLATQPVAGSTNLAALPQNTNSNNQTSMEDTMAEDTVQTSALSTSVFGQVQSSSNSIFKFASPSPSVTPGTGVFQFGGQTTPASSGTGVFQFGGQTTPPSSGTGVFQFGGQTTPASSLNQAPFQASGSFNAGGGFSLGKTDDKSQRKIVKVKRNPKRR